jgi:hypothetical protein
VFLLSPTLQARDHTLEILELRLVVAAALDIFIVPSRMAIVAVHELGTDARAFASSTCRLNMAEIREEIYIASKPLG